MRRAVDDDATARLRRMDAGDDLDQRRLAGAVLADQAMDFAAQPPTSRHRRAPTVPPKRLPMWLEFEKRPAASDVGHGRTALRQVGRALPLPARPVRLASLREAADLDQLGQFVDRVRVDVEHLVGADGADARPRPAPARGPGYPCRRSISPPSARMLAELRPWHSRHRSGSTGSRA